jgi:hypothetical protein
MIVWRIIMTENSRGVLVAAAVVMALAVLVIAFGFIPHPSSSLNLPPCATEDSHDCHWDAAHQGNGLGRSFTDLHGVRYYSVPACTDALADAGAVCWGEPR